MWQVKMIMKSGCFLVSRAVERSFLMPRGSVVRYPRWSLAKKGRSTRHIFQANQLFRVVKLRWALQDEISLARGAQNNDAATRYEYGMPNDHRTVSAKRRCVLALRLVALVGCGACTTIYEKGIDTADQLIKEAGLHNEIVDQRSPQQISLVAGYKDTEFGRRVHDAVLKFPALTGQSARIAGSTARLDALKGSLRPQVSYGVTAGQDLIDRTGGSAANAGITVRQLLFDGAATQNRVANARIAQQILSSELDVLLSTLARQMAAAELDVWRQRELLALAEENVAAHRSFVQQTRSRALGGVIAESDLLSASSRLSDANARLAQASSALAGAEANYNALIGSVPDTLKRPPAPPTLAAQVARQRIQTAGQTAIARLRLADARSQYDIARSGRYPGIFLEVSGGRSDVFGSDPENETFAGFSIDQSLFQGGQQRARERESASAIAAAKSNLDEVEVQLTRVIEVALATRETTASEIAAAAEAARFNAENLTAIQQQFRIGRRDTSDILDAQRDLVNAKSRIIDLEANSIETEFLILEATGDLASIFGIDRSALTHRGLERTLNE